MGIICSSLYFWCLTLAKLEIAVELSNLLLASEIDNDAKHFDICGSPLTHRISRNYKQRVTSDWLISIILSLQKSLVQTSIIPNLGSPRICSCNVICPSVEATSVNVVFVTSSVFSWIWLIWNSKIQSLIRFNVFD